LQDHNTHRQQNRSGRQVPTLPEPSLPSAPANGHPSIQEENNASIINQPAPNCPISEEQEVDQLSPLGHSEGLSERNVGDVRQNVSGEEEDPIGDGNGGPEIAAVDEAVSILLSYLSTWTR
jgi:hypothetical protein